MYKTGNGVSQNLQEARKWYSKAAEQGNETAKEELQLVEAMIAEQGRPPRRRSLTRAEIMSIARRYGFEIRGEKPSGMEVGTYGLKGLEDYELYAKSYWGILPQTYYVAVLSCGVRYGKAEMFKGYGGLITYDELRNDPSCTLDYLRAKLSCMDDHRGELVMMLMELKELP